MARERKKTRRERKVARRRIEQPNDCAMLAWFGNRKHEGRVTCTRARNVTARLGEYLNCLQQTYSKALARLFTLASAMPPAIAVIALYMPGHAKHIAPITSIWDLADASTISDSRFSTMLCELVCTNLGTDTFSEFEYSTMNFKKFREGREGAKPLSGTCRVQS